MIFGRLAYLIYLFIFAGIILVVFWILHYRYLRRFKKEILQLMIIAFLYSWITDNIAIRQGVWDFSPEKILGVWLAEMPLEEWAFVLVVGLVLVSGILILAGLEEKETSFWRMPIGLFTRRLK